MLERWSRGVVRLRVAVLVCWLAVVVLGALSAVRLPGLLSTSLAVPGTGSERADAILSQHFGENPEGTFAVVFLTGRASARERRELTARLARAARSVPTASPGPLQAGPGILYGEIVTRLDLQHAARYAAALRRSLEGTGVRVLVTGAPALQHDLDPILAADLRRGEAIALPIALLLLAVVLGLSAALLVPLVFAACTVGAAEAIVFALAHRIPMVSYVPNVVELVGFGLAIDYSLLIVHRFREEIDRTGSTVDEAVLATMATAGRAVLFSGAAVTVGLSLLLVVPVPFVRSMGIAGLLVPLVSMVAALTVQPALLSLLGRRGVERVHLVKSAGGRRLAPVLWAQLVRWVLGHRRAVLAGTTALLVAAAVPVAWLQLTPGSTSEVPRSTSSAKGLELLRRSVGPGLITPIEVVLEATTGSTRTAATSAAVMRLAGELGQDPEVFAVAIGSKAPYVDPSGRYRRIIVIGRHDFGAQASQHLVDRLRHRLIGAARFPANLRVYVGGPPAQGVDFLARVYGTFPWIVLAALALTYLLLLAAFRSLVAPLISVVLTLLSLAASYGLLVLAFPFGLGADVLGLYREPQIEGWIPVFLFAMLFSLSMDYQVFLVTRMREAWEGGLGSEAAVARGLERTGTVVSAAALIMVATFTGLMTGRVAGLQELGTGLALGILLDATVVRMLVMPSLVTLLGRGAWWLPGSKIRPARAEASPLAQVERRGPTERPQPPSGSGW